MRSQNSHRMLDATTEVSLTLILVSYTYSLIKRRSSWLMVGLYLDSDHSNYTQQFLGFPPYIRKL